MQYKMGKNIAKLVPESSDIICYNFVPMTIGRSMFVS